MHGDRAMKERVRALDAFRDREVRVLVATDVAQRGLDVEGISHVINYDVPQDPDSYVHRVGRTARAGQKGEAITFMSPGEIGEVRAIEHHIGRDLPASSWKASASGSPRRRVRRPARASAVEKKAARATRGHRMGSRAGKELTPEELEKLLGVG
jgi:ATP-dependent RNA helicase RhlE